MCRDCGRQSRDKPQTSGYSRERREEILRAYQESGSIRGLARIFGVSRNTVSSWLKDGSDPTEPDSETGNDSLDNK
ncbi:MAG TPA: helix-turn-helix domain-containing protein [Blastocatellia bacterium]|nr:helix-turn-helix domain-containing protein [Blastocatellia bacterium]